jgi:hypothetical protein
MPDGLGMALRYAILLALAAVVLAVFLWWPQRKRESIASIWLLGLYVALLGMGFMSIEIPLIQRFVLVLGEPALALAVVLGTLLVAGGTGSLVGSWLFDRGVPLAVAPMAVALVALLLRLFLPPVQSALLGLPPTAEVAGSILVLLPVGFLLGIPFPLGLRLAAQIAPQSIALLWTVSAAFSALGSVLAALIAIEFGFSVVLLLGVGFYGAGAIVMVLMTAGEARPVQAVRGSAPAALAGGRT